MLSLPPFLLPLGPQMPAGYFQTRKKVLFPWTFMRVTALPDRLSDWCVLFGVDIRLPGEGLPVESRQIALHERASRIVATLASGLTSCGAANERFEK